VFTYIANDEKATYHLCRGCAEEKGVTAPVVQTPVSVANFLANVVEESEAFKRKSLDKLRCRGCGMTYREFRDGGRLGCGECFDEFREALSPLLKRIHGAGGHVGRRPAWLDQRSSLEMDLARLKERLRRAVRQEEFEVAARLRDAISTRRAASTKGTR
jgi:protein arginine kinase activator